MKDIVLPLTCKQILWIVVPLVHILFVVGWQVTPLDFNLRFLMTIFGFIGVMMFWLARFMVWSLEGKLPHFKCRCDKK